MLLLLIGCAGLTDGWCERFNLDCAEYVTREPPVDNDSDVFSEADDCNDFDSTIHPAAVEVCDFIDNNCDGQIDEGFEHFVRYTDSDRDGFGTGGELVFCELPEDTTGLSPLSGDCDDSLALIHPDASEICDGVDNDCDGTIDVSPDVGGTWYSPDSDGDGFGSEEGGELRCDKDSGWSTSSDDCDDTDAGVHPEALELPDGIDNNCDGIVDVLGLEAHYPSGSEHVYGERMAPAGDLDGDGLSEVLVTMRNATSRRLYTLTGASLLSGSPDELSTYSTASGGLSFGEAIANIGPINADGLDDVLIGEDKDDEGANYSGSAWIYLGDSSGSFGWAAWLYGTEASAYLGSALDGGEDLTDDGVADLLIGAHKQDDGGSNAGGVWLVDATVTGEHPIEDVGTFIAGAAAGDYAGRSVALLGDIDGDGISDAAVGANGHDAGKDADAGAVFVLQGGDLPDTLADAEAILYGEGASAAAGFALAAAGDVDGDGLSDVLVGAHNTDRDGSAVGAAYVVTGGALYSGSLLEQSLAVLTGGGQGALAGYALDSAGDLDDDGLADVLIGAPGDDTIAANAGVMFAVLAADLGGEAALWDVGIAISDGSSGARTGETVAGLPIAAGQTVLGTSADKLAGFVLLSP